MPKKLDTEFTAKRVENIIGLIEQNLVDGKPKKLHLMHFFSLGLRVKVFITERKDKGGYRHEISLHTSTAPLRLIGQGTFASVSDAFGVIVSEEDGSLKKVTDSKGNATVFREYGYQKKGTEKEKIIKISKKNNKTTEALIKNEVINTASDLRMRSSIHHMIMNKAPGVCLEKLLKKDHFKSITFDHKVALVLALFEALNAQVHKRNISHNDIKPDNIIVDLAFKPFEIKKITIIDYGLSLKLDEPIKFRGTAEYIAPEVYQNNICRYPDYKQGDLDNSSVDIFAMAVTAIKVLGFELYDEKSSVNITTPMAFMQDAAKQVVLYPERLDTMQMENIDVQAILAQALKSHPAERASLSTIIDTFTDIVNTTQSLHTEVVNASTPALP